MVAVLAVACEPDTPQNIPDDPNQEEPKPEPEPEPEPEPDPETGVKELPYLSGIYFGNQYGATENDYNYSLILATNANCYDIISGNVLVIESSQYLFLDLYSATPAEEYNIRFNVPVGEYKLDVKNTASAGTISAEYTSLYTTDEYTGTEVFFTRGKVTVTAESIEAKLLGEDGVEYQFVCPVTAVDNSQNFRPSVAPAEQSTLEDNVQISFSESTIAWENYGDYYVVGKDCWILYMKDDAVGHTLFFELMVPLGEKLPLGRFPLTNDLNEERLALPGYVNGFGETTWSWYTFYEDYTEVTDSAPIVEGEVRITDSGNDTVTVVIDVVDDMGYTIKGLCTDSYVMME